MLYFTFQTEKQNKMRAVLINSTDKTVKDIEISETNTLQDWYKAIGCSMVEVATYINDDRDSILVDEEGLMRTMSESTTFFQYEGANQPFFGNGLVVGVDDEGNSVSCHITALEVATNVSFKCLRDFKKF